MHTPTSTNLLSNTRKTQLQRNIQAKNLTDVVDVSSTALTPMQWAQSQDPEASCICYATVVCSQCTPIAICCENIPFFSIPSTTSNIYDNKRCSNHGTPTMNATCGFHTHQGPLHTFQLLYRTQPSTEKNSGS